MTALNLKGLKKKYDSVHCIGYGLIDQSGSIVMEGVGSRSLIFLHDSTTNEGVGIFGAHNEPHWIEVGDQSDIFGKFSNENFKEFKLLAKWKIKDVYFLMGLLWASWFDDIFDFEAEYTKFEATKVDKLTEVNRFVGAAGIWIISQDQCSASYDPTSNSVTVDGQKIDDVFETLSGNGRQHGFMARPR